MSCQRRSFLYLKLSMLRAVTHVSIYIYIYMNYPVHIYIYMYRVIHKYRRDFRPLRYSSRDGHAEGEHINRGRDTRKLGEILYLSICSILLSVLVIPQQSSEVSKGLMNCPIYIYIHCATSRKVAGSIPDGVIGIFHWHNPSGRTMALRLTQPLTEMSTRSISLG